MATICLKLMLFAVLVVSGPIVVVTFPTTATEGGNRSISSTEAQIFVASTNGNCTDDYDDHHYHFGDQSEATSKDMVRTRMSWRQTFKEIRSLVVPTSAKQESSESQDIFSRWKAFLDEKSGFDMVPPSDRIGGVHSAASPVSKITEKAARVSLRKKRLRYDGFLSWEKLLQQWADDVSDYVSDPIDNLTSKRAGTINITNEENLTDGEDRTNVCKDGANFPSRDSAGDTGERNFLKGKNKKDNKGSLVSLGPSLLPFEPRPVEAGEAVVAKTDLSDKTKNIWIVTTAALPWMTGTAVNPLLRAAYMCAGRAEAGGSVTILLPWLERNADQIRVYGEGRAFKSRGEQEKFVRNWLRDTAGMGVPSTELRIRWYTAWQERAENSIYSMGDITSLIPEDEADICVSVLS